MTIAKMVVEIEARNRALKSTLADSTRGVNAFAREVEKANKAIAATQPTGNAFGTNARALQGQIQLARQLSNEIISGFKEQQKALKGLLKSDTIDKGEFTRRGQELMDATIKGAKSRIEAFRGVLGDPIANSLISSFEKGGLKGAAALERGARNVKIADRFLQDLENRTTKTLHDIDAAIGKGLTSSAERSLLRAQAFAKRNEEILNKISEMESKNQMRPALRQAMEAQLDPRGFGIGISRTEAEKAFQESASRIRDIRQKLQTEINRTKLDLAGGLDAKTAAARVRQAFAQFKQSIQEERARVGEGVGDVLGAATSSVAAAVQRAGTASRLLDRIVPTVAAASRRGAEIGRAFMSGVSTVARVVAGGLAAAVLLPAAAVVAAAQQGIAVGRSLVDGVLRTARGVSQKVRDSIIPAVTDAARRGVEIGRSLATGVLSSVRNVATRVRDLVVPGVADAAQRGALIGRSIAGGVIQSVRGVAERVRAAVMPPITNATQRGLEIGRSLAAGALSSIRGVADRVRAAIVPPVAAAAQRGADIGRSIASSALAAARGTAARIMAAVAPTASAALRRGTEVGSAVSTGVISAVRGTAERARDAVIPRVADAAQRGATMGRAFATGLQATVRGVDQRVRDSVIPRAADAAERGLAMGRAFTSGVIASARGVSSRVRDAIFVTAADAARKGVDAGRALMGGIIAAAGNAANRIRSSIVIPAADMARRGIDAGRTLVSGILEPLRLVTERLRTSVVLPVADMARRGVEAGTALATSLLSTVRGVADRVRAAVMPGVQGALQTGTTIGRSLVAGIATAIRRESGLFKDAVIVPIAEMTRSGIAAGRALATGILTSVRGTGLKVRDAVLPVVNDAVQRGAVIGRGIAAGLTSAVAGASRKVRESILPAVADVASVGAGIGVALAGGVVAASVGAAVKVRDALVPRSIADVVSRGAAIGRGLLGGVLNAVRGASVRIRDSVLVPVADFARRGVDAGSSFVNGLFGQLRGVADRVRRAVLPAQGTVTSPRATNLGIAAPAAIEAEMAKALGSAEREVKRLMSTIDKSTAEGGTNAGKSFFQRFDEAMQSGANQSITRLANIGKQIGGTLLKFATIPIAAAGAGALKLAGDAEQAAKRLQISFGPASVQLQRNLNALRNEIPATSSELDQMASRLGELIIPIGLSSDKVAEMATNLIKVTKNISLFAGVSSERAFNAVINGLVGQSRELKKLGIEIDDATIRDRAYRDGLARTGSQLDTLTKVQAGYLVIMERTRLIEGTLAQSQGTFNVKLLFFTSRLKEAGIAFGTLLLPALTRFLGFVTNVAEGLSQMSDNQKAWTIALAGTVAVIGPLLIGLSAITKALLTFSVVAQAAQAAVLAGGAGAGAGALGLGALAALANPVILLMATLTAGMIAYGIATSGASKETKHFREEISGMSKAALTASRVTLTNAINENQLQIANLMSQGVKEQFDALNKAQASGTIKPPVVGGTEAQRKEFVRLRDETARWQNELKLAGEEIDKISKAEAEAAKFAKAYVAQIEAMDRDRKSRLLTEELARQKQELRNLTVAAAEASKAFTIGRRTDNIDLMNKGLEKARETLSQVNVVMKAFQTARADPQNAPIAKQLDNLIKQANTVAIGMQGIIDTAGKTEKLDQFSSKLTEIRKQLQLAAKTEDFTSQQEAFAALADLEAGVQKMLTSIAAEGDEQLQSRLRTLISSIQLLRQEFKTIVPIELFAKIDNVAARLKALQESGGQGAPVLSTGIPLESMKEAERLLKELNDLQFKLNEKLLGQKLRGEDTDKTLQKIAATQKLINQNTPNLFEQMFGADAIQQVNDLAARINAAQTEMQDAQLFGKPEEAEKAHLNMLRALGDLARLRQAIIDTMRAQGFSETVINAVMQGFAEAYKKAGGAAQDFEEKVDRGSRRLARLGLYVGIIRQIAEAFGLTGGNIDKAVSSLGTMLGSIDQLRKLQQESDKRRKTIEATTGKDPGIGLTATLQQFSAGLGILVSAFNAATAIVNAIVGKSAMEIEHDRILEENNQKLAELRLSIDKTLGAGEQTRVARQLQDPRVLGAIGAGSFAGFIGNFGKIGTEQINAINLRLKEFNLTWEEVLKVAKDNGIQILDSKGRVVAGAFDQLAKAIQLSIQAAFTFGNTLDDQTAKIDLFNNVFDVQQTPQQIISDQVGLLAKLAPDLFKQFFAGVDLNDAAAVKTALQAMVKAFLDGAIDFSKFGALFNKDEFIRIITSLDSGLDQLTDTVNDANAAITNVPDWFKTNQVRFISADPFIANVPNVPLPPPAPPTPIDVNPTPPLGPGGARGNFIVQGNVELTIVQQPGEDSEAFADRVISSLRNEKFMRTGTTSLPGIDN